MARGSCICRTFAWSPDCRVHPATAIDRLTSSRRHELLSELAGMKSWMIGSRRERAMVAAVRAIDGAPA